MEARRTSRFQLADANDEDNHEYEYVYYLCATNLHDLSDHSLDRNYRVVSISDASPMRRAREYLCLYRRIDHPKDAALLILWRRRREATNHLPGRAHMVMYHTVSSGGRVCSSTLECCSAYGPTVVCRLREG